MRALINVGKGVESSPTVSYYDSIGLASRYYESHFFEEPDDKVSRSSFYL